ncbi:hypothetical protein L1887_57296 [Cichorium endivia]|nr:hypothetical protein L1887_57296 [Cichorium endivia]
MLALWLDSMNAFNSAGDRPSSEEAAANCTMLDRAYHRQKKSKQIARIGKIYKPCRGPGQIFTVLRIDARDLKNGGSKETQKSEPGLRAALWLRWLAQRGECAVSSAAKGRAKLVGRAATTAIQIELQPLLAILPSSSRLTPHTLIKMVRIISTHIAGRATACSEAHAPPTPAPPPISSDQHQHQSYRHSHQHRQTPPLQFAPESFSRFHQHGNHASVTEMPCSCSTISSAIRNAHEPRLSHAISVVEDITHRTV